jgi:hypothetical protein
MARRSRWARLRINGAAALAAGERERRHSTSLGIEKIGGGKEGVLHLEALDPGRYPFMGELHSETARGAVVAEQDRIRSRQAHRSAP